MLIKNISLDSNFIISILSDNHSYRQPPAHGNSENNSRALFIRHRHLEDTGKTLGGFEFHKLTRIFKNIASLHFDARNTDNAILPYSCPINTQTLNTLFTKPSMYYILAHGKKSIYRCVGQSTLTQWYIVFSSFTKFATLVSLLLFSIWWIFSLKVIWIKA